MTNCLPACLPAGEASHLLWIADSSQADLGSRPRDRAEALTLQEQQQRIEVGWCAVGAVLYCGLVWWCAVMWCAVLLV
jgi:hypothetical protein